MMILATFLILEIEPTDVPPNFKTTILIVIFYLPYDWTPFACALIFFIAGFTDALDGYLARALNQSTRFGAFLDPVADKMMVVVAFVLLVESYDSIWMSIPAIATGMVFPVMRARNG